MIRLAAVLAGVLALASAACERAPAESVSTEASVAPAAGTAAPNRSNLTATPRRPQGPATTQPAQALGAPPVEFHPPVLDFGPILPNESVNGEFVVTNLGDTPLRIVQATTTCQCTSTTNVNGRVLQPGEFMTMEAGITGRTNTGTRREGVRFIFEGYAQYVQYDLVGEVTLPVRATPTIFNLAGGDRTGHVAVESLDGRPFNIFSAYGTAPRYLDFDADIDEPRNRYVLEWDLTGVPDEAIPRWWIIETDHPDCPVLDCFVRHPVTLQTGRASWYIVERRVNLGWIEPGSMVRVTATLANIQPSESIQVARSLSSQFDAVLERVERTAGTEFACTVRLDFKPSARGTISGAFEIITIAGSRLVDVLGKVAE